MDISNRLHADSLAKPVVKRRFSASPCHVAACCPFSSTRDEGVSDSAAVAGDRPNSTLDFKLQGKGGGCQPLSPKEAKRDRPPMPALASQRE